MSYNKIIKLEQESIRQKNLIQKLIERSTILTNEIRNKNTILKEKEARLESYKCEICYTNNKDIILNPCFHFNICNECLQKITKCPVCREPIECYHIVYC